MSEAADESDFIVAILLAWFKTRFPENGKMFLETKQILSLQDLQQALMAWWEMSGGPVGGSHNKIMCNKCGKMGHKVSVCRQLAVSRNQHLVAMTRPNEREKSRRIQM